MLQIILRSQFGMYYQCNGYYAVKYIVASAEKMMRETLHFTAECSFIEQTVREN